MLNTLMDISEAETGIMKLDRELIDVSGLMKEVLDIYHYVAEEKDIDIHLTLPPDLSLIADPIRISQAMANLLDNAIKYTPVGGKIDIEARQLKREIMIAIKDSGIGIPREEMPKIWDRLYRGDQSRSQKGLGLGLSLLRAIIRAHKGRIEVLTEPGKGSTFSIYLPAHS
jgi:signal transduction histidine kinase